MLPHSIEIDDRKEGTQVSLSFDTYPGFQTGLPYYSHVPGIQLLLCDDPADGPAHFVDGFAAAKHVSRCISSLRCNIYRFYGYEDILIHHRTESRRVE